MVWNIRRSETYLFDQDGRIIAVGEHMLNVTLHKGDTFSMTTEVTFADDGPHKVAATSDLEPLTAEQETALFRSLVRIRRNLDGEH